MDIGAEVMRATFDHFELATVRVRGGWLAASCIGTERLPAVRHTFSSEDNARFVAYLGLSTHFGRLGVQPPGFNSFVWRREQDSEAWLERLFGHMCAEQG
jgi:hypothetical protein